MASASVKQRCVDCVQEGVTTDRPIAAGIRKPRCATHERARKHRARASAHASMVQRTYNLTGDQYAILYQAQGGVCAICRVATGKVKRLAVDHDHDTGEVRGLLCGPCNQTIGRLRVEALVRAVNYLYDSPARRVFNS